MRFGNETSVLAGNSLQVGLVWHIAHEEREHLYLQSGVWSVGAVS